ASWETVGVGANILEASWEALSDGVVYGLLVRGGAPLTVDGAGRGRPRRPPHLVVGGVGRDIPDQPLGLVGENGTITRVEAGERFDAHRGPIAVGVVRPQARHRAADQERGQDVTVLLVDVGDVFGGDDARAAR